MNDSALPFPQPVYDKLKETLLRVNNSSAATRLYERMAVAEQQEIASDWSRFHHTRTVEDREHVTGVNTVGMWMHVKGVSQPRAIVDVGYCLNFLTESDRDWLLREIGEQPQSVDDAVLSLALVLDERERAVYWQGQRIEVDWYKRSALWTFLWTIAEQAQSGGGVDRTHFGEDKSPEYVSKTISRLSNEVDGFPADLAVLMVSQGLGTARLDLSPEQIGLFRTGDTA